MDSYNWCYALCNSFILPLVALLTAAWTAYQEYRHQKNNKKEEGLGKGL